MKWTKPQKLSGGKYRQGTKLSGKQRVKAIASIKELMKLPERETK